MRALAVEVAVAARSLSYDDASAGMDVKQGRRRGAPRVMRLLGSKAYPCGYCAITITDEPETLMVWLGIRGTFST